MAPERCGRYVQMTTMDVMKFESGDESRSVWGSVHFRKFKKGDRMKSEQEIRHRRDFASEAFAHTSVDGPWEPLETHLEEVAEMAGRFGGKFGLNSMARQIGLWHDVGKYSAAFQKYLRTAGEIACQEMAEGQGAHAGKAVRRVDHSTPGAKFAIERLGDDCSHLIRQIVFNVIAGHHTGLLDHSDESGSPGFMERLRKTCETLEGIPAHIEANDMDLSEVRKFQWVVSQQKTSELGYQFAFLTRMAFSCLVDADFLCTERFMDSSRHAHRTSVSPQWDIAEELIEACVAELSGGLDQVAEHQGSRGPVFAARNELYRLCREKGDSAQGLFELSAPTGTGKTLASVAFAVRHAAKHGLDRIIYALPFTSIVEQTTDVFRGLFGDLGPHFLIEHHSDVRAERDTTENRLHSENWNAPMVVTTNVRLFESLFANRPGACRKLHNVARSVIVLDEPQALPPGLLLPCLKALEELRRNYGVSVLFCSATPPAIERGPHFPEGISGMKSVVPEGAFADLPRRVRTEKLGTLGCEELARKIVAEPRSLCIVNTRISAQKIYRLVESMIDPSERSRLFHLSTWMCGQHRSDTLTAIKRSLSSEKAEPCRLISTQVVEAGVDLDFPVVFRELAGFDSLTQAAGRCNREGRERVGRFCVFDFPDQVLRDYLRLTVDNARSLLTPDVDPIDPEEVRRYFEMTYWSLGDRLDKHKILSEGFLIDVSDKLFPARFHFKRVATDFRMIDAPTDSILVPYGAGRSLAEKWNETRQFGAFRDWRALQRHSVNVHRSTFASLLEAGALTMIGGELADLTNSSLYDKRLGLDMVNKCPQYLSAESMVP
jgi:CRISPR-associated endonuclease/helicase Cas3